ncbi:hypothetical protein QCA50_002723 [Cerrena zonata]|uniref:Uncharacterized protein n=1 Tax=Cerrena zonata TaxID=2478898 RepID=A0AAW0GKH0_9APHY
MLFSTHSKSTHCAQDHPMTHINSTVGEPYGYSRLLRLLGSTTTCDAYAPTKACDTSISSLTPCFATTLQPASHWNSPLDRDRNYQTESVRNIGHSPPFGRIPFSEVPEQHLFLPRMKSIQDSEPADPVLSSTTDIEMETKYTNNASQDGIATTIQAEILIEDVIKATKDRARLAPNIRFLRTMVLNDKWANSSRPMACPPTSPTPAPVVPSIPLLSQNASSCPVKASRIRRRMGRQASVAPSGDWKSKRTVNTTPKDKSRARAALKRNKSDTSAPTRATPQPDTIRFKGRGVRKAPPIYHNYY